MAHTLVILDDYQKFALKAADWSVLGDAVKITQFEQFLGFEEDGIAQALEPFEILVCMRERTRFPASLLARLPNLKLLITTGMRNLAIDMEAARSHGIDVCGTAMLPYPAAEHAVALIMDLTKRISAENRVMHEGGWQAVVAEGLNGKTLGVLGLGNLGARVARFGLAMEMNVVAWSENLTDERCAEVGDVVRVSKDDLFRRSDILSIHTLLSDRTQGIVGAAELGLMKPTAYIVNTSRGPIIDEAAMVAALSDGTIRGAGLDVYDVEPLPMDHPLRKLDNAVLTGHTGYVVEELYAKAYGEAIEDTEAWLDGSHKRLLNPA